MSIRLAAALAVAALVPPAAAQAAPTASLPAVKHTLAAAGTTRGWCDSGVRSGARGVASTSYRVPMAGYLDIRSAGSDRSDWDLALYDRASGKLVRASQQWGSHEVIQTFAVAGQRLVVQACHRRGSASSLPVAIRFHDIRPPAAEGTPMALQVYVRGLADVATLDKLGADVTHDQRPGSVTALVSGQAMADRIVQAGLKYRVLDRNLTATENREAARTARYAATAGASGLPTGRKEYRVLSDYEKELKQIVDQYKGQGIVRPVELPKKSFQGRALGGVEFAKDVDRKDDGRPVYFVMALHHAREWPSAEAAMEFAWLLAKSYGEDKQITSLLERERIVVVPVINPDGFNVSRSSFSPYDTTGEGTFNTVEAVGGGGFGAYRRKNCDGAVPDPSFPCELQWGVDPNRNYGDGWGGPGASSIPYTQTYRGSGPWSEPETQAVHEYSQTRQVTSLLTIHNFASLVLRPPGLTAKGKAIDEDAMKKIGDEIGDDTGYTSQFSWQLYDTSGTTEEWNYGAAGTFGYTIEMGPSSSDGGNFHIDYQRGVVEQWDGVKSRAGKGMRQAMLTLAEAGADTDHHSVIKGVAPPGALLRVKRTFETATGSLGQECGLSDPTDVTTGVCENQQPGTKVPDFVESTLVVPASGRYEWHVGPSTRPFVYGTRFPSKDVKDGRTDTIEGSAPPDQSGGTGGENDHVDHPFTITDEDNARRVTIDLEFTPPTQDLDLEIYQNTPDGPVQVASSGGPPGQSEEAILEAPQSGSYFARVINFLAVPGSPYTLTIKRQTAGPDTITVSGKTEAWKLSCENGGKVQETRDVTVWRGDTATANLACGDASAVLGIKKKHRVSRRTACLRKASKLKSRKKRKAAVKRCNRRYPAKKKKTRKT